MKVRLMSPCCVCVMYSSDALAGTAYIYISSRQKLLVNVIPTHLLASLVWRPQIRDIFDYCWYSNVHLAARLPFCSASIINHHFPQLSLTLLLCFIFSAGCILVTAAWNKELGSSLQVALQGFPLRLHMIWYHVGNGLYLVVVLCLCCMSYPIIREYLLMNAQSRSIQISNPTWSKKWVLVAAILGLCCGPVCVQA